MTTTEQSQEFAELTENEAKFYNSISNRYFIVIDESTELTTVQKDKVINLNSEFESNTFEEKKDVMNLTPNARKVVDIDPC